MTTAICHSRTDRRAHFEAVLRNLLLGICLLVGGTSVFAAGSETFKARLSPLGVTNATVDTTTGIGSATATLAGTRLTIEATFEGLTGNATAANVRRGPKGIPGPVVFELEVPKASSGKISATLQLTEEQLADLREARLYLQIHSERAKDGSIRGWLLSPKR
jgi:CHRD domain